MRSLDKFYKYLENRETGEDKKDSEPDGAEAAPGAVPKPSPAAPSASRYVIRNGVTVAVPREQSAPAQSVPVPEEEVNTDKQEAISEAAAPVEPNESAVHTEAIWRSLPENVQRLALLSVDLLPDATAQAPERRQLIERLLNPLLSLEDTARLLGVCTATVRRYANKGALAHQRTIGQQRRFLLSDVLALMEARKPSAEEVP